MAFSPLTSLSHYSLPEVGEFRPSTNLNFLPYKQGMTDSQTFKNNRIDRPILHAAGMRRLRIVVYAQSFNSGRKT